MDTAPAQLSSFLVSHKTEIFFFVIGFIVAYATVIFVTVAGGTFEFFGKKLTFPGIKPLMEKFVPDDVIFDRIKTTNPNLPEMRELKKAIITKEDVLERLDKFETNHPVMQKIKEKLVTDQDVLERLMQFRSYHAVTVVLAIKEGEKIADAEIKGRSSRANEFYGLTPASGELIGKKAGDLFEVIKNWMEPEDYQAFVNDQNCVMNNYQEGRDAFAKVPIKFNNNHPSNSYNNKTFLPIIVGLAGQQASGDRRSEYLTVLYLDVEQIQNSFFNKPSN